MPMMCQKKLKYVLLLQFISMLYFCHGLNSEKYIKDLFRNYSPMVKPKRNLSQPVEVDIIFHINALRKLSERFQTITLTAWIEVSWTDDFLQLNDGVESLTLPLTSVWTPDISLYNSVGDPQHLTDGTNLVLMRNGQLYWYPSKEYTFRCSINIELYPFDMQSCTIILGAWHTPVWTQVFIAKPDSIRLDRFIENGNWVVSNYSAKLTFSEKYNISNIQYTLHFQRRWMYGVLNTLLPIILLSFLNALVFRLPVDSGEKITLCISVLLSYTVFLTVVNEMMPRMSTNISYLSIYLCVQLIMCVIGIIASVQLWRWNTSQMYEKKDLPQEQTSDRVCDSQQNNNHIGKDSTATDLTLMSDVPYQMSNLNNINHQNDLSAVSCSKKLQNVHLKIDRVDNVLFYAFTCFNAISTSILLALLLKDWL